MILEEKVKAKIDEINGIVYFDTGNNYFKRILKLEISNSLLFDKQILNFCLKALHLSDYVKQKIEG